MSRIVRRCVATICERCMLDGARRWHGLHDVADDYANAAFAIFAKHLWCLAVSAFKQHATRCNTRTIAWALPSDSG